MMRFELPEELPFPPDESDDNDEFAQALLNAMTYPLSPEDIQIISEGYTCGFIPPERRHLYLDPDWF